MKQNGPRLNHVGPHQFGLDRTNWYKCGAFFDLYDSIGKELIKEKFMTMLEEPEWQDKDRNHVEFESETFGCKVTSKFS